MINLKLETNYYDKIIVFIYSRTKQINILRSMHQDFHYLEHWHKDFNTNNQKIGLVHRKESKLDCIIINASSVLYKYMTISSDLLRKMQSKLIDYTHMPSVITHTGLENMVSENVYCSDLPSWKPAA